MKPRCTKSQNRHSARLEHEGTVDIVQERLDRAPEIMKLRRRTVEYVFGTLKAGWVTATS